MELTLEFPLPLPIANITIVILMYRVSALLLVPAPDVNMSAPVQDANSGWQALPYEIASAYVRTLALHLHQLQVAKESYAQLIQSDPSEENPATRKAKSTISELKSTQRFIVMNARTGHLATQDWVSRNMTRKADGTPQWKNKHGSKTSPWVMTFFFTAEGVAANLSLKLSQASTKRQVRCWDLRNGGERSKLSTLLVGYEHMMGANLEEDEEVQVEGSSDSDGESSATEIGDQHGLEGPKSCTLTLRDMLV